MPIFKRYIFGRPDVEKRSERASKASGTRHFSHIDGLRALAIIPVVLYHFFPAACPGGYAGVDVFLVISGFLITRGIVGDLESGTFSIAGFYVRRIKRILPAYFGVIVCVLIAIPWRYTADECRSVAVTMIYSVFYLTNLYFSGAISYFDLSAKQNPLLHLWSLAVEEQFYLIVPILMWILWKAGRSRMLLWNLILLFAASFLFSVVCIWENRVTFAFFMLPTRAWELLAGSILSRIYPFYLIERRGLFFGGWMGVLLLLFSYCFYNDATPFPGVAAIPPALGACLLIACGDRGFLNKMLSWNPAVWIGKASYSLYLWHWPILVMIGPNPSGVRVAYGAIAIAGASFLSYRFVETPVRIGKSFGPSQALALLAFGSFLVATPCWWIIHHKERNGELASWWRGNPTWRLAEVARRPDRSSCRIEDLEGENSKFKIKIGSSAAQPSFALWGDSFALALLPGVDKLASEYGRSGFFINLTQTLTLDPDVGNYPFNPKRDREVVIDWLCSRPDISSVYLVNDWSWHLRNDADIAETYGLCERLVRAGKKIYFFTEPPCADGDAVKRLSWGERVDPGSGAMDIAGYEAIHARQNRLVDELTKNHLAIVIPVEKAFLHGSSFWTSTEEESYFLDIYHLNGMGAERAMRYVAPMIWSAPGSDSKQRM